jgi:3-dehydroquinate dehydratase I
MICIAVSEPSVDACLKIIKGAELAEIRLDLTGFTKAQTEKVFSSGANLVATCRPNDTLDDSMRSELLLAAIKSGARYVDVEIESELSFKHRIINEAEKHSCDVIISYHNFEETPKREHLKIIVEQCFSMGAQVAKVVCMVKKPEDNAILLSLYEPGKRIISFGMGETGKISRIAAPLLGAEFTFASADNGQPTAPGQFSYTQLKSIIDLINNS